MSERNQNDVLPQAPAAQTEDQTKQALAETNASAVPLARMSGPPDEADAMPAVPAGPPEKKEADAMPAVPDGPLEPDDPLGERKASFGQHYYVAISDDVELLSLNKRRTGDYWELGKDGTELKAQLPHGDWLRFLESHGYVERTVQRAMRIYKLFKNKEECISLTVEEAENFGKAAEKAEEDVAKKAGVAGKQALDKSRKDILAEAAKKIKARQDAEKELLDKRGGSGSEVGEEDGPAAGDESNAESGGEEDAEDEDQDVDDEMKSDILWNLVGEVSTEGFSITDAEREAFALFAATVGEERAVLVALYQIWAMI